MSKLFHISMTGIYAGYLVCGKERQEMIDDDEVAFHIGTWLDNPDIPKCEKCMEIYNSTEDDTHD